MSDQREWVVTTKATILHSTPNRSSTVIKPVPAGVKLLVADNKNFPTWTKVKYKNRKDKDNLIYTGYIRNDYLVKA